MACEGRCIWDIMNFSHIDDVDEKSLSIFSNVMAIIQIDTYLWLVLILPSECVP